MARGPFAGSLCAHPRVPHSCSFVERAQQAFCEEPRESSLARGSDFLPCSNDLTGECRRARPLPSVSNLGFTLRLSDYLGTEPVSCLLNLRPSSCLHLWLYLLPSSVFEDQRLSLWLEPSRRGALGDRGLSVVNTNSASLQPMDL